MLAQGAQHLDGVGVGRPRRRVDDSVIQRLGVVVGQPGLAKRVHVGLAVQVRREVAVEPGLIGLPGQLHRSPPGGVRQPLHQFGLHVLVDRAPASWGQRGVDQFHAGEPAVVLLETEQRAGEVEEDGAES